MTKQKKQKSTQIGIRLDPDTMKDIKKIADWNGMDKNAWIKQAILFQIQTEEDAMKDEVIQDYIRSRIDDKEFIEFMEVKSIPEDLVEARKKKLLKIVEMEK